MSLEKPLFTLYGIATVVVLLLFIGYCGVRP